MANENTSLRGDRPIQSKYRSMVAPVTIIICVSLLFTIRWLYLLWHLSHWRSGLQVLADYNIDVRARVAIRPVYSKLVLPSRKSLEIIINIKIKK